MTDQEDDATSSRPRSRSEELLRGNFLHVVRDHVRLPDGSPATREYVVHPGAVVVVPLLDDGRVVLERQHRHPHRPA
jgi:ADP-ribose pyrophosphatase